MIQRSGCAKAMSFSWSVVQIGGDVIATCLGHGAHAASLGQVLAQQSIEVLVAAALPGVVRRGEVNLDREALFESGVVVELSAVVEGDGLKLKFLRSHRNASAATPCSG